ncbi:hypothetical protein LguiB_017508 [Lonicera macranthoides]
MTISMTSRSSIMIFNTMSSQRFQSNMLSPDCNLKQPKQRIGSSFLSARGLKDFSTIKKINRDFAVNSSTAPSESGSPSNPMRGPRGWLLGTVLTIALPFTAHKWGPLPKWKKDIQLMVETVERITNKVESTAGKLHEVAEHIEESLPHGKLRNAFDFIENTAEEIAKGANVAGDLIDKIQEVDEKVDIFIEQSKLAKETEKVATTTTTTTTTKSVAVAQAETQNGDSLVEPVATLTVVNEVVKEEVITSRQK